MKKWKITFRITFSIIILSIVLTVIHAISLYFSDTKYPYPALGIDIHNWFEAFQLDMAFALYIFGIPILIDIILFIISIIKIKKLGKES